MESWADWHKPFVHGTFVVWPPDDVREVVNALRQRYDSASRAICEAHITLTQPLLSDPEADDWAELRRIAAAHPSFELAFGPLRSFLPYPCIWFETQPAKRMLALRAALHGTGLFNLDRPYTEGFVPHMTITEGLSGPAVNEALLEALQGQVTGGIFQVSEIAYVAPDENFHFSVQGTLALGAANGG